MEAIQTLLKNSLLGEVESEALCKVDWSFIHSHLDHMKNWQSEWNQVFENETYHLIKVLNIQQSVLILGVDNSSLKNILHFEEKNILSKIVNSLAFKKIQHLKVMIIKTIKIEKENIMPKNIQKMSPATKQILLQSVQSMDNPRLAQSITNLLNDPSVIQK